MEDHNFDLGVFPYDRWAALYYAILEHDRRCVPCKYYMVIDNDKIWDRCPYGEKLAQQERSSRYWRVDGES